MPDLATITSALTSLKTAVDLAKMIKSTDQNLQEAEHKSRVADLLTVLSEVRIQLADVQQTLLDKDAEIKGLKADLEVKGQRIYEAPYYWVEKDGKRDGPFCQQCQDKDNKLIRLQSYGDGCWGCKTCQNNYQDSTYSATRSRVIDSDYDPFES